MLSNTAAAYTVSGQLDQEENNSKFKCLISF